MSPRARAEIDELFAELDQLLKNPDVGAELTERGVNTSLAMTLADGLHAYLRGEKEKAVADLETAVEEIAARMKPAGPGGKPS